MPSLDEIVPLPHGKITPSLRGSYNYNTKHTPEDWVILCPDCSSDNVCCLAQLWNPDLEYEHRWFCISCHESWRYGLEH